MKTLAVWYTIEFTHKGRVYGQEPQSFTTRRAAEKHATERGLAERGYCPIVTETHLVEVSP